MIDEPPMPKRVHWKLVAKALSPGKAMFVTSLKQRQALFLAIENRGLWATAEKWPTELYPDGHMVWVHEKAGASKC